MLATSRPAPSKGLSLGDAAGPRLRHLYGRPTTRVILPRTDDSGRAPLGVRAHMSIIGWLGLSPRYRFLTTRRVPARLVLLWTFESPA